MSAAETGVKVKSPKSAVFPASQWLESSRMVPHLTATQFVREMTVGRTAPLLCGCQNHAGQWVGEYVLKILGKPRDGQPGAILELVASRLATHFGILVPRPAVIEICADFAGVLSDRLPNRAAAIEASIGLNFGSEFVSPMTTWPTDAPIPAAMWRTAVDIFSFDAMLQNPDRSRVNPNLFTRSDDICIFDHETSFSFLFAILPQSSPWNLEHDAQYLEKHVFYRKLKGKEIDLTDFSQRLAALNDEVLAEVRGDVPAEWEHPCLDRIETHLHTLRSHGEQFVEQIRRRLV